MDKCVVIAQDRAIFKKINEALGIELMKITSALAAKTLLKSKEDTTLVIIDVELKDSDSVVKLVNSLGIPVVKIGEDILKPLTQEAINKAVKQVLQEETDVLAEEKLPCIREENLLQKDENESNMSEETEIQLEKDAVPDNEAVHNEMLKELDEIWDSGKRKSKPLNPKIIHATPDQELISRIKAEVINEIAKDNKTGDANNDKGPQEQETTRQKVKIARQLVAAVWSAKPGVGKTFMAVNLGVIYAQAGFKTIVVDADTMNLSVGIHLNLMDNNRTIEKALKETNVLKINDYVLQHPKIQNLYILSGSEICRPENYTNFPQGSMTRIINTLRETYDVILIDTATEPALTTTYEALKVANKVLVLVSLDHAVTFNTKKYLMLLKKIRVIDKKFSYVLNKDFPSSKVNKEILEKSLGISIKNTVPNHYDKVTESIFESKPIVLYNTTVTQPVRDALTGIASEIYPFIDKKQGAEEKHSLFKRLFKGRKSS